jgi:hypothetical protein
MWCPKLDNLTCSYGVEPSSVLDRETNFLLLILNLQILLLEQPLMSACLPSSSSASVLIHARVNHGSTDILSPSVAM